MHQYLIDLKVSIAFFLFTAISFSKVDIAMKVITFILVTGFTIRRWYLMEKNKKE
jgi:hypothetical protein